MSIEHKDALLTQASATVNYRVTQNSNTGTPFTTPITIPHCVGRFRVLGEIARGGMGVVLRAYDADLDREIAVKLLAPDIDPDSETGRQFVTETRVAARLRHPGIIPVYESGHLLDGRPYFAMPLLEGESLTTLLLRRQSLADNLDRWLAVLERVCRAIGYAHRHGVVHRDLKPGNVLISRDGEVVVLDWGVAVAPDCEEPIDVRQSRWVFGTPAYMPPEQARGHRGIDPRSDIFGLGAILCEILTGLPPHVGSEVSAVTRLAYAGDLRDAVERLLSADAHAELIDLSINCLAANPVERPPSANAVLRRLRSARRKQARRPGPVSARRRRASLIAAVGVMTAAAILSAATVCKSLARADAPTVGNLGESVKPIKTLPSTQP